MKCSHQKLYNICGIFSLILVSTHCCHEYIHLWWITILIECIVSGSILCYSSFEKQLWKSRRVHSWEIFRGWTKVFLIRLWSPSWISSFRPHSIISSEHASRDPSYFLFTSSAAQLSIACMQTHSKLNLLDLHVWKASFIFNTQLSDGIDYLSTVW